MKKHSKILIPLFFAVLLAVSLVPLLMLARYVMPSADDFGYATPIHYALKNGSGFIGILKALADNIWYTYLNWQGTFSSVFLFSVQPDVFGMYYLTTIIMLAIVISPQYVAMNTLSDMPRWSKITIASIISLVAVQFLPSVADGLYWWNGAVHYLVFWFLMVLVVCGLLRLSVSKKADKMFYIKAVAVGFGAFLVGGGNYSTALVCAVLLLIITIYNAISKKGKPVLLTSGVATGVNVLGLLISIIAPGNSIRQAGLEKMGAIEAVATSFFTAASAVFEFTDLIIISALVLCVPIFVLSTKNCGYKFRYPLLVCLGSFCVFAAMFTPPLYAMGMTDVPRMNNMFYLAYLAFVFGNAFYVAGWLAGKKPVKEAVLKGISVVGACVFLLVFVMQATSSNAFFAYSDLKSDTLKTYINERKAREQIYEDKTGRFSPISAYPACFTKAKHLTWASELIVDGEAADLKIYRSCGGEVTFVGLSDAIEFFGLSEALTEKDFSKVYYVDEKTCVPLREVVEMCGFDISYDSLCDVITINSK